MKSTKQATATCVYLGVDITDRHADSRRGIDVCGLEIGETGLIPHFWTWSWGSNEAIDLTDLLPEISAAKAVMLDGPQGLARVGCSIRTCERALAAAGKTADTRPPLSRPYGGFVASSLDLFAAFHGAGLFDPSSPQTHLHEVYPAAIWTRLARRLPNKRRRDGRLARAAILQALGVGVPDGIVRHDELDACAAALLAAAADGRIQGISVGAVGDRVYWDDETACLREGQILVPEVNSELRAELQNLVRRWELPTRVSSTVAPSRTPGVAKRTDDRRDTARPLLTGTTAEERGNELLELLVGELLAGRPTLCTYKAGVAAVLGHTEYAQGYGAKLTSSRVNRRHMTSTAWARYGSILLSLMRGPEIRATATGCRRRTAKTNGAARLEPQL